MVLLHSVTITVKPFLSTFSNSISTEVYYESVVSIVISVDEQMSMEKNMNIFQQDSEDGTIS